MSHVHCIAQHNDSCDRIRLWRQPTVGHIPQWLITINRLLKARSYRLWQRRQYDSSHIIKRSTSGLGCRGNIMRNIHKNAGLVQTSLIEKEGREITKQDMSMVGRRQDTVREFQPVK